MGNGDGDFLRVISVYRPPSDDVAQTSVLSRCIHQLSTVARKVLVVGDFNAPQLVLNDQFLHGDNAESVLFDCFTSLSFSQFVTSATRGKNILDLVLSADESLVSNVQVGEQLFGSDHRSVEFDCTLRNKVKSFMRVIKNWKHMDVEGAMYFLSCLNWNELFSPCATSDDFYAVFQDAMNAVIATHVPDITFRNDHRLFFPPSLNRLRARKRQLYKYRENSANDKNAYCVVRCEYTKALEQFFRSLLSYDDETDGECEKDHHRKKELRNQQLPFPGSHL